MEAVERQFTSHCKSRAGLERARSMRSCRNISGNWDVSIAKLRVPRNPSRVDAKRGDHFLQADFRGLIPPWKPVSRPYARNAPDANFTCMRSAFPRTYPAYIGGRAETDSYFWNRCTVRSSTLVNEMRTLLRISRRAFLPSANGPSQRGDRPRRAQLQRCFGPIRLRCRSPTRL